MKLNLISGSLIVAAATVAAHPARTNQSEYEYIVVGSGAGGGTVASELARKGHSVFLIEAGGDQGLHPEQQVPGLSFASWGVYEGNSWNFYINHYRNQTQARRDSKYVYRLTDGSTYYGLDPPPGAEPLGTLYPRGATLGGSTQVNALNWAKPSDNDWDWIANYTSDESWGAEAMEKYSIALENCLYCAANDTDRRRGFIYSNRNNVTYVTGRPNVAQFMSDAALEVENITIRDNNHLTELLQRDIQSKEYSYTEGIYQLVISMNETRRRSGSRNHIIDTINAGFPLTISPFSLATRVLFNKDGDDVVAHGVEYLKGEALYAGDSRYDPAQSGELKTVTATREVIVAGGAINTPQILKLSGIGPREELENLGIEVIVDSPTVGKYLQDHPEGVVRMNSSVPLGGDPMDNCRPDLGTEDPCLIQWNTTGTGPYGEGAAPLLMRYRTSTSENEDPDVWIWGFGGLDVRGFYPGAATPPPAPRTYSFSMLRTQTLGDEAIGAVTLRSANPRDVPNVDFDWFPGEAGDKELTALVETSDLLYRIFDRATEPVAPMTRVQPAEGVQDIRQNMMDESYGHHAGCSCRMGTGGVQTHCIDPQLRVNGVKGLRVVDASAFPRILSAFPQYPIYMLGLKAADMISAAASNSSRSY
ncbi:GMC oxidoreductase [Periconia macrospinosa]|uniref:GMC oxidoreductase n=1 Tax=Periconia macrospinosa TaxID=97972 RepID=A0A2V1DK04_9PLEO|nr:GMC oxidoreductase [Periconia macrospinosa]